MKETVKRIVAGLLAIVLTLTATIPGSQIKAATGEASLDYLGKLGTVNIGNKSEGGTWLQTLINEKPAFCMDIGKACHTGYTYVSTSKSLSSDSSNKKNSLEARIGYWYAIEKDESNKAWVYAQCLIWAVEEGITSEADLKYIIEQVKDNTGYYADESLYSQIFEPGKTVACDVYIWEYTGKTDETQVQSLMQIVSTEQEYRFYPVKENEYYRQRITLQKVDEDGNALPQATFRFTIKNIKELSSYKYNGWGDSVNDDIDVAATKFVQDVQTDSKGKIVFRFTYHLNSGKYYYVKDEDLSNMSNDDKKEIKEILDDKGYKYPDDLKKSSADKMAQEDIESQMNDISNEYVIEEISSNNDNILTNFVVDEGFDKITSQSDSKVTLTLTKEDSWTKNSDGKWPETAEKTYGDYKLAYKPVLRDKFKKVKLTVEKRDSETGTVAQGDASLEGAVYGLYSDAASTKLIKSYTTDSNNQFETDAMRCGYTYYLKEITPPRGYLKNDKVYTFEADGQKYSAEYNVDKIQVTEEPVEGDVEIIKGMGNGEAGIVPFESNAQFQIYLASAGSYDKAKESEKDILTTDKYGYAKSKKLPYGTYVVHQTIAADGTEKCPDFYVNVEEHGKTYKYLLNNPEFTAYLKIVKKDSRTKETVLKAGTTYQIYKVESDGNETLVTQSRNNGNKIEVVDRFVTDETGEVITYEKLEIGSYRVYEIEGPEGYKVNTTPVDVVISEDSYKTMTDEFGNVYLYAEYEYYNSETYGKFTICKDGVVLYKEPDVVPVSDDFVGEDVFEEENSEAVGDSLDVELGENTVEDSDVVIESPFNYMSMLLDNVVFELVAREDILSQDNQGTVLFEKDSLVATITTGKGAEFTNTVDGICKAKLNYDGTITLDVPLGEYTLKEVKTAYGYVLPEQASWDLSFKWDNKNDECVFDSSENTVDGTAFIYNDLAVTEINLEKKDSKTEQPIEGAVFGFYSKDNIYDINGNIVVKADEKLCEVITDNEGKAKVPFVVPFMDEGYEEIEEGTDVRLNSGDYFFLEEGVSDSYFISKERHYVHLEYVNQDTPTITADVTVLENQTEVVISKKMIASSVELKDCHLKISDVDGNEILSWISGDKDSVKLNDKLKELGYCNFYTEFDEDGAIKIYGLLHDKEYILSETKPADGYVTASDITFMIKLNEEAEEFKQDVLVKNEGEFVSANSNTVVMYDDTTKIEFSKLSITDGQELPSCKMKVTDKETGAVMDEWTSTETNHLIEGKYVVGRTYILSEIKPADGYVTATDVEFTVLDDGNVQKVSMVDDTTKVEFNKLASDTKKQLKGAKYEVYDSKGNKVYEFKTGKKPELIEGVFKVGETYTFKEVEAPKNYKLASDKKITIKDTGEKQKLSVVDIRIPDVPDTPQTGMKNDAISAILYLFLLGLVVVCIAGIRAKENSKYNFTPEVNVNEENKEDK